jgi:hypothetical protein
MSDGYRSERSANWLVWCAAGALILLALAGGLYGITKQFGYEQAADDHAQEYARYAHEKAEQPCRVLPSLQKSDCLANAKREQAEQARDKRREYDDLVAQQKSALWTNIMGLAAITGMILSVMGVWLVYATFRETRRTANEAARSADAFIANERGWLKYSVLLHRKREDQDVASFGLRAWVSGKANIEISHVHYAVLERPDFPNNIAWTKANPRVRTLVPDPGTRGYPIFSVEIPAVECFFGGYITYETQFPGPRRAYFIFKLADATSLDGKAFYGHQAIEGHGWPDST